MTPIKKLEIIGKAQIVVFIIFLILKVTNIIAWSWWWVTAPLWGPIGLGIVMLIGLLLIVWGLMKNESINGTLFR